MSFGDQLLHSVEVVRPTRVLDGSDLPTYDEGGHVITAPATVATWQCLIQPKTTRELALAGQGGASVADHTIFGWPADIRQGDRLECTDGRSFEVLGVPDDAGGQAHHLEVQALRVYAEPAPDPAP